MLRRRFVQNGEILIGVNRNEIHLNPSLQLVCGTLLIFTALPLVQLTVQKCPAGRLLLRPFGPVDLEALLSLIHI